MFRIPMLGFALLAFLLLSVVLAIAVFLALKSGEQGKTKLGGCAGCAIAFALLVIAGIGGIATLVVGALSLKADAMRHGPVKSFDFRFPKTPDTTEPRPPAEQGDHDAYLRLELRGIGDESRVIAWLRDRISNESTITVEELTAADGNHSTAIEVRIPMSEDAREELQELRRNLEQNLPVLQLPESAHIEFRGPDE